MERRDERQANEDNLTATTDQGSTTTSERPAGVVTTGPRGVGAPDVTDQDVPASREEGTRDVRPTGGPAVADGDRR